MSVNEMATQNIRSVNKKPVEELDARKVAMLWMSQRNVGTYGTQPVGNQ